MQQKYNIALVCDYFYPSYGGIETHIEMLALTLKNFGHNVIIITHKYDQHVCIKYLNDIKVYYMNCCIIAMNTSFPALFTNFFKFAKIYADEKINIVHGHQTMSSLAIEALFHAKTFNIKTVLTEHSLFEVGGFENILVNNVVKIVSRDVDKFLCVSYTTKKNLMDRLGIESERVYVIPNGIVLEKFYPKNINIGSGNYKNLEIRLENGNEDLRNLNRVLKRNYDNIANKYISRMLEKLKTKTHNNQNRIRRKIQELKSENKVQVIEKIIEKNQLSDFNNQTYKNTNDRNIEFADSEISLHRVQNKKYNQKIYSNQQGGGNIISAIEYKNKKNRLGNGSLQNSIKIAIVTRFVPRKGVDILIRIIPKLCKLDQRFFFVMVGDGYKRDELEQVIENHELDHRIIFLGAVDHDEIPDILRECDIFLNTSLTESFCMAILEACSCGLQVVSTNVGGIHEVLPDEMITLTSLDDEDVTQSIINSTKKQYDIKDIYKINRDVYSWEKVTQKTIQVYDCIEERKRKNIWDDINYNFIVKFIIGLFYFFENVLKYFHDYF